MVKVVSVVHMRKVKKAVPVIEKKVKVHFSFTKNGVVIKGKEYDEYIVETIVRAIDFGFDVDDAFLLFDSDFVLEFLDVKSMTRRKNTKDVRARLIGTKGKALKTIENLTESVIVVSGNSVAVIVDSDHLDAVIQAIESLVRGAKHGNVFVYLEKQKGKHRFRDTEDLGLRKRVEDLDVDLDEDELDN